MPFIATAKIEGISPYGQNRYISPNLKKEKETHSDFEQRIWRERLHADSQGNVIIPPMALKNCLSDIAKFLSVQIPGKGKATYTKHFEAGILCQDPIVLPIKKDDVPGQWLYVPSDGKRGGSSRVEKCFPVIHNWGGDAIFYILDETVTKDVFLHHLKQAGSFIGLGFFRPRRNGYWGRFQVNEFDWREV